MQAKITKSSVDSIDPTDRDQFIWDTELPGFGLKVTPSGVRSYVFQYSVNNRTRRITIGRHGVTKTADEARREAIKMKGRVADRKDPAEERTQERLAPTLEELAVRYLEEHASVKKKKLSAQSDERNLRNHILPELGRMRVVDIDRSHVAKFHYGMRSKPGAANRCVSLLSKIFNLAEIWGVRTDGTNPTRHIEKYPEKRIERYLSEAELSRLSSVLAEAAEEGEHASVVAAIRLLIFTGCRRNEILTLKWDYVDFAAKCLRLPDSKTGAKLVPLGAPALEVLANLERLDGNPYVLPGQKCGAHYVALEKRWRALRKRAGLEDVRLHDLRHSFASMAAAMGESLYLIGSLLGHSNPSTTSRYAHLSDDPRRAAAERISNRISNVMNNDTKSYKDSKAQELSG